MSEFMTTQEAKEIIINYLDIATSDKYEYSMPVKETSLYQALQLAIHVLDEYDNLIKELSNLAIESVERDKILAKLESEVEVMRMKDILGIK